MTRSEAVKFVILRSIGNFLLLFTVFALVATFGPALYYELQYKVIQARGVEYKVIETTKLGELLEKEAIAAARENAPTFGSVLTGPTEQILTPIDPEFSLLIPKIGANSKVFPNVDPENEKAFLPLLLQGIAHAKGTVFPGIPGNTYLFAHSTDNFWDAGRYNAVFYLLKDLAPGDDIVIFFDNVRHNYVVTGSQIVDADDTRYINYSHGGAEILILQTCWPPGTAWKRLLVFAKPK